MVALKHAILQMSQFGDYSYAKMSCYAFYHWPGISMELWDHTPDDVPGNIARTRSAFLIST